MNIYAIFALVNVATSVVLGMLVMLSDRRSRTNQTFALFSASVAIWSYSYFMWQIQSDAASAFWWVRALIASAAFITPIYYHFTCRFLGIQKEQRIGILAGYLFILLTLCIVTSAHFIRGVAPISGFAFWPVAGPLFTPFLLVWIGYAIYPIYLLSRGLKDGEFDRRSAIKYIIAGTIIGYAGGCTNYFLWYGIHILPFGNISASIYLSLVAYAIMRHRLFNMKVIATELIVFFLWLVIFARMLLADAYQDQLFDAGLLGVLLITGTILIRSVDKEVEQRELIQRQEKDLEQANRQQESLLHFISHEIKGYLTKNQAVFASIVSGDFGATSPDLAHFSQAALDDTRKGVATVMDILDASNLKTGKVAYEKKSFDLSAAIASVVSDLTPDAAAKGIALQYRTPVTGACMIEGDENKIRHHVLRNVIDNSIKYTPKGSVTVDLTRDGSHARVVVSDTGVGITPDDMQRLFTEGGHGKDSIKVNVHSTGYGLYISKQVVEAHGGTIHAESDGAGRGSRFIIELPLSH